MLPPWYSPWLKVSLALRMALTYPWDANAWAEVGRISPGYWLSRAASGGRGGSTERGQVMERRTFVGGVSGDSKPQPGQLAQTIRAYNVPTADLGGEFL